MIKICVIIVIILEVNGLFDNKGFINTEQFIRRNGYPLEKHYVTTEDGYILGMQRIPYGRNDVNIHKNENRSSVLLTHGLFGSSSTFMDVGPKYSLGYQLADAGFDVWLYNARGTSWSNKHQTLKPTINENDNKRYWDFSWHELGYYDNPAVIDYILNLKNETKLFYIGHSQGATTFLVTASTRPEYNKKIKLASLLGPSASFKNYDKDSVLKKYSTILLKPVQKLLNRMKFYGLSSDFVNVIRGSCVSPETQFICARIIFGVFNDINPTLLNKSVLTNIFMNLPDAASVNQAVHYAQQLRDETFQQFDYGKEKNLIIYGQETPPKYDLSHVTAPVILYHGKTDDLVNNKDTYCLAAQLPNVKIKMAPEKVFNHFDFIFGLNRTLALYKEIINDFKKALE